MSHLAGVTQTGGRLAHGIASLPRLTAMYSQHTCRQPPLCDGLLICDERWPTGSGLRTDRWPTYALVCKPEVYCSQAATPSLLIVGFRLVAAARPEGRSAQWRGEQSAFIMPHRRRDGRRTCSSPSDGSGSTPSPLPGGRGRRASPVGDVGPKGCLSMSRMRPDEGARRCRDC
jgi:hypothetical protein